MSDKDEVVERKQEVLAGTPVFKGTRVPIKVLFDYLKAGDGIEDFLNDYPTVKREKVVQLLQLSSEVLVGESSESSRRCTRHMRK